MLFHGVAPNDRVDRARAQSERSDATGRYHEMPAVRAPVAPVVRRAFPPQVAIPTAAGTRGLPLAPTVGCSRHRHRRAALYAHAQSRTSPASEAPTIHPRY